MSDEEEANQQHVFSGVILSPSTGTTGEIRVPSRPPSYRYTHDTITPRWWLRVLLLCMAMYTISFYGMYRLVYPLEEWERNRDDRWLVLRSGSAIVLFFGPGCSVMCFTLMLRTTCVRAVEAWVGASSTSPSSGLQRAEAGVSDGVVAGVVPPVPEELGTGEQEGSNSRRSERQSNSQDHTNEGSHAGWMVVDREGLAVAARWNLWLFVSLIITGALMGVDGAVGPGIFLGFITPLFTTLPRTADRWCRVVVSRELGGEERGSSAMAIAGRGRGYLGFIRRSLLIGVPMTVAPTLLVPELLKHVSPDSLVSLYPLAVSFVEYLTVSKAYTDAVVEGFSAETMSMLGRLTVATFEAARVGLLVVVTNTTGSMQGLVIATLNSAILEALSRNNVISPTVRLVRLWTVHRLRMLRWYLLGGACGFREHHRPTADESVADPMGRFKQVYLGCKMDTEYWAVYTLVAMRLFNYTVSVGMDEETGGQMKPALRCGWDVIAVVMAGELLGDVLAFAMRWFSAWMAPDRMVHASVIYPSKNVGLLLCLWGTVGHLYIMGVAGMGTVVDAAVSPPP